MVVVCKCSEKYFVLMSYRLFSADLELTEGNVNLIYCWRVYCEGWLLQGFPVFQPFLLGCVKFFGFIVLGADHLTLEGGGRWFLVIKNFFFQQYGVQDIFFPFFPISSLLHLCCVHFFSFDNRLQEPFLLICRGMLNLSFYFPTH